MPSTTILITGATGNVSSAVIDALPDDRDVRVRALVRDSGKASALEQRGIELATGDLDDPRTLGPAFEGVDGVWMLATLNPRAPEQNMNMLWAARQAGVSYAVRMSAVGAAYDAPTRNGRLHALSDHELMASGLHWTILKPHFFMQNQLGSAGSIADQGAIYLNMGGGRLGMIDVRDIGAVAAKVLISPGAHRGKTYTLTGPASISFEEAAGAVGEAIGKPVSYAAVPSDAARDAMTGFGMPQWVANALVEYGEAYSTNWGDFTTTAVADIIGRRPRSFADFARDFMGVSNGAG